MMWQMGHPHLPHLPLYCGGPVASTLAHGARASTAKYTTATVPNIDGHRERGAAFLSGTPFASAFGAAKRICLFIICHPRQDRAGCCCWQCCPSACRPIIEISSIIKSFTSQIHYDFMVAKRLQNDYFHIWCTVKGAYQY